MWGFSTSDLYCMSFLKLVLLSNWTTRYFLTKTPRLLSQMMDLWYMKARSGRKYFFAIFSPQALQTTTRLSMSFFPSFGHRFAARKSMSLPMFVALEPFSSISFNWIFKSFPKHLRILACHFLISSSLNCSQSSLTISILNLCLEHCSGKLGGVATYWLAIA